MEATMNALTKEARAYAVARLQTAMDARGFNQQKLHELSQVAQSTISRILSPSPGEHYEPSEDTLRKLFKGIGLDYDQVMGETEAMPKVITGYLASPLTAVVKDPVAEKNLYDLVKRVRAVVCSSRFPEPTFDLYWPGDHTHHEKRHDQSRTGLPH